MAYWTRVLAATATAVLACVFAPGMALAANVNTPDASHVNFTGSPSDLNDLTVSRSGTALKFVDTGTNSGIPVTISPTGPGLVCVASTTINPSDTVTCTLTVGTNIRVDTANGVDQVTLASSLPGGLVSTVAVFGGSNNDTLIDQSPGPATLSGDAGNDLIMGPSSDTVDYSTSPAPVTVDLGNGFATGDGFDGLSGVGGITGSNFNDVLTGD